MNSREIFYKSIRRETVPRFPIWLMRQAGRYMLEYRQLREKYSFMELCHEPDLATEITMQPIRKFKLDAAILFCDILVTAEALGADLDIVEKKGPVIGNPFDSGNAVKALLSTEAACQKLAYVPKTLRQIRSELGEERALLGFAGAPLTVGSYMIEGMSSQNMAKTFRMMLEAPDLVNRLFERLTDVTIQYVQLQREAGVDAIQIFESWASILPEWMYLKFAFPHLKRLIETIYDPEKPIILFALANGSLWAHLATLPVQVLSVGPNIRLSDMKDQHSDKCIQGNLDARYLLCDKSVLLDKTNEVLNEMKTHRGYIFNLGHGITPKTPVENVEALCERVHTYELK